MHSRYFRTIGPYRAWRASPVVDPTQIAFFGFVAGDASHRHYYYFATCRAASDPIDQMRLFEFIQIVPGPTIRAHPATCSAIGFPT